MHKLMDKIRQAVFGYQRQATAWSDAALALLRIHAGFTMMSAGLDKLPVPEWMTDQVVAMGFPLPGAFAWIACVSEFVFGALLVVGFATRISAFFLAVTIGFACFRFHGVMPLIGMHITQLYFWIFILFAISGPGRYSIDSAAHRGKLLSPKSWTAILVLLASCLIIFAANRREGDNVNAAVDDFTIDSVNIAGSFNNWDPADINMQKTEDGLYAHQQVFSGPQAVEFKFTANGSWDVNLGELDQQTTGFPITGNAELDNGNNTENIKAYIPAAGTYLFTLKLDGFEYSINRLEE